MVQPTSPGADHVTIQMSHEAMRTARSDVTAARERLVSARRDASRRVTGLLGSGWSGVAADTFADAWEDWETGAARLEDGLDTMQLLLGAVHRDMTEQDDSSQAALDQISQRIVDRLG